MVKIFYTYELIDPRNNVIFYVGKGQGNRMYRHLQTVKNNKIPNNNKHLFNKLKQLLSENIEPLYNKFFESTNEEEALREEIRRISEIGLENLCNLTSGGLGVKSNLEIRNKISKNHADISGKNNPMYGKHHTIDTKNKMSEIVSIRYKNKHNHPWHGKRFSYEHRQKLSILKLKERQIYTFRCKFCDNEYCMELTHNEFKRHKDRQFCSRKCVTLSLNERKKRCKEI